MRGIIVKLIVWLIPLLLFWYLRIDYLALENFSDLLMGSIALAASSLGFFIAGISIMQTSNLSRFYNSLVELGTDKKINGWLMTTIGYLFLLSFMSIFILFFDIHTYSLLVEILFIFWISTLVASFLSGFFVVLIIMIVFSR